MSIDKRSATGDVPARAVIFILVVAVSALSAFSFCQFYELRELKLGLKSLQSGDSPSKTLEENVVESEEKEISDTKKVSKRQAADSSCGGEIILQHLGDEQTITSPGYPEPYGGGLDCEWVVKLDQYPEPEAYSSSFETAFTELSMVFDGPIDTEYGSDCQFDYVEIRSGSKDGSVMGKYCGQKNITEKLSTKGLLIPMFIRFRSDESVGKKGFSATLKVTTKSRSTGTSMRSGLGLFPDVSGDHHAVFTRWGRDTCPKGVRLYDGYIGGLQYGSQQLHCLPLTMDIENNGTQVSWGAYMTYATLSLGENEKVLSTEHVDRRLLKCALCDTLGDEQFMVAGWDDCHSDYWTTAYSGYLMAEYSKSGAVTSDAICVDSSPDVTFETRLSGNSPHLSLVRSGKGFWYENRPIPCVVCIRNR